MNDLTILIVNHNELALENLKYILELTNDRVITASDAQEGLKLLDTICPDLIIANQNLQGMKGSEFYDKVKERKECTHIPLIFFPEQDSYASE